MKKISQMYGLSYELLKAKSVQERAKDVELVEKIFTTLLSNKKTRRSPARHSQTAKHSAVSFNVICLFGEGITISWCCSASAQPLSPSGMAHP